MNDKQTRGADLLAKLGAALDEISVSKENVPFTATALVIEDRQDGSVEMADLLALVADHYEKHMPPDADSRLETALWRTAALVSITNSSQRGAPDRANRIAEALRRQADTCPPTEFTQLLEILMNEQAKIPTAHWSADALDEVRKSLIASMIDQGYARQALDYLQDGATTPEAPPVFQQKLAKEWKSLFLTLYQGAPKVGAEKARLEVCSSYCELSPSYAVAALSVFQTMMGALLHKDLPSAVKIASDGFITANSDDVWARKIMADMWLCDVGALPEEVRSVAVTFAPKELSSFYYATYGGYSEKTAPTRPSAHEIDRFITARKAQP